MGKHQFVFFFTLALAAFAFMVPGIIAAGAPSGHNHKIADDNCPDDGSKNAGNSAMDMQGSNSTRRALQQCAPTNPIDNCWRCKPDWADNRQALGQCALGFGKGTTGGTGGEVYVVKDPSDDPVDPKDGTLRFGCIQDKPLWITFEKDMTITLTVEMVVNKDKTIDGRGAKVELVNGGGFAIYKTSNVIIHGITVKNPIPTNGGNVKTSAAQRASPRSQADGDGIAVFGSNKVWIDHCSFSGGPDGLIDVTMGSTAVTISNCLFTEHDKVMLLGADDSHTEDQNMQVTVAFNKFGAGCTQRMPRCRFGFFHVVNNDYDKWGMYAVGGSAKPSILSEGNRYTAPDDANKKKVTVRNDAPEAEWKTWNWKSKNDLLLNGAIFEDSGSEPTPPGELMAAEPADSMDTLVKDAGVLTCSPGTPC